MMYLKLEKMCPKLEKMCPKLKKMCPKFKKKNLTTDYLQLKWPRIKPATF